MSDRQGIRTVGIAKGIANLVREDSDKIKVSVRSGSAGFGALRRVRCPKTLDVSPAMHRKHQGFQLIRNLRYV